MNKQNGFTLITLIFLLGLAVFVVWLGFKIVPVYMDYYAVKNSLENILKEDTPHTNEALRKTFEARMNVNFIRDLNAKDLQIDKDNGTLTLMVPITRQQRLTSSISLLIELEAKASAPLKQ